jgi:hypothetical protein
MNADKAAILIRRLIISTGALATLSAALLMFVAMRPIYIKEVMVPNDPGQVIYDLGDGRKIIAPGDGVVEWEGDFTHSVTPATTSRTDTAEASGVEFKSHGSATGLVMELDFGTPTASIPDGGTSVGGYANMGVKALFTNGGTPLYIIAGLSIIIGCVLWFWLKAAKLGLGFIVGGVALFAVTHLFTTYPWILLVLMFIALIIVGIILWDYWKKKKTDSTVSALVAAGESLPIKLKNIFTNKVRAEANARGIGKTTRTVVTAMKASGRGTPKTRIDITDVERKLFEELKLEHSPSQPQVIVVPQSSPPAPPSPAPPAT